MANPLQTIGSRLATAFQRLSEREKRLVSLTAVAAVVFLVGGGTWAASGALDDKQKRVAMRQEQLDQILSLRERYQDAEQAEKRASQRVRSNNTSLFSL